MTKIRTRRAKGSSFEYDVHESLQQKYPNIYLTKQRGFQLQYDLQDDVAKIVIECKRHRILNWNQLERLYEKLRNNSPKDYDIYLIFQLNRQPCLVYSYVSYGKVCRFEDIFSVPFKKHTPIKRVAK